MKLSNKPWDMVSGLLARVTGLTSKEEPAEQFSAQVKEAVATTRGSSPPTDTNSLVEEMLALGRYALLLRPQIAPNLNEGQMRRALAALDRQTSLVEHGQLCIGLAGKESDDNEFQDTDLASAGTVVEVEGFRLDRFEVTNQQFQQFIDHGGYSQATLWEPQVWPAVVDFVDRTGRPGPRFWSNGRYAAGEEDHPVVGVSWYEAAAYARWVGKRLPSDAEWEKAGCWPVELAVDTLLQRRYPWGDGMERARTNIWGSGPGTTVPVDKYPEGASAGGVYQLIGNVWEWTAGDYGGGAYQRRGLNLATPMKSIRGGAYDTYFDNQATCQFQSGENPVARKHNIGFRCAVSTCDLTDEARRSSQSAEEPALQG
jgi:iron(II)-dependent oxidoreductase